MLRCRSGRCVRLKMFYSEFILQIEQGIFSSLFPRHLSDFYRRFPVRGVKRRIYEHASIQNHTATIPDIY